MYDLLVTGSCHNIIFKDLILLKYEVYKYSCNTINLDIDILDNLKQKTKHPSLKCDFKLLYSLNNIDFFINFSTYHTFTHSRSNSIFIFKSQYFNNCDFVIDQCNSFSSVNYLGGFDLNNLNLIKKYFTKNLVDSYVTNLLIDMFTNKNQNFNTQIIYFDKHSTKINPLKWIKNFNKLY